MKPINPIPPEKLQELNDACDRILARKLANMSYGKLGKYSGQAFPNESPAEVKRKQMEAETLRDHQCNSLQKVYGQVGFKYITPTIDTKGV